MAEEIGPMPIKEALDLLREAEGSLAKGRFAYYNLDDPREQRDFARALEAVLAENKQQGTLLSAAPDMLAALKRVEADLTFFGAKGQPLKDIRAAIAKAEGRR